MNLTINPRVLKILSIQFAVLMTLSCEKLEMPQKLPLSQSSTAATGLKPISISDLIEELLPLKNTNDFWERGLDAPIVWITNGVETDAMGRASRVGLARVHVENIFSTVLENEKKELAWTVTMSSTGPVKLGPQRVEINVGPPEGECFGSLYSGCDFTPEQALANKDFSSQEICRDRLGAGNEKIIYRVSTDDRSGFVTYAISAGSGGASSWIEISEHNPCREIEASRPKPRVLNW